MDTNDRKVGKVTVYSPAPGSASLHLVESTAAADYPIQVALRIKESLWRRVKIEAIKRGVTITALAEQVFEGALEPAEKPRKTKGEK